MGGLAGTIDKLSYHAEIILYICCRCLFHCVINNDLKLELAFFFRKIVILKHIDDIEYSYREIERVVDFLEKSC